MFFQCFRRKRQEVEVGHGNVETFCRENNICLGFTLEKAPAAVATSLSKFAFIYSEILTVLLLFLSLNVRPISNQLLQPTG